MKCIKKCFGGGLARYVSRLTWIGSVYDGVCRMDSLLFKIAVCHYMHVFLKSSNDRSIKCFSLKEMTGRSD